MNDSLHALRIWLAIVAAMAMGNSIKCFLSTSHLKQHLYAPEEVTGLAARMFGAWTMLAAILRIACCIWIRNKGLYLMTLISFPVVLFHYGTEVLVYETAELTKGVLAAVVVSSVTGLWMFIQMFTIEFCAPVQDSKNRKKE